jgi:hypothetical protein
MISRLIQSRASAWPWRAGVASGLLLALALVGCYPGGPEDLGDIGMALTFKAPQGDFSGLQTYAMPDTVLALINPDDDTSEPLDRSYDGTVLAQIANQLESRGFTRIDNPDESNRPDVLVAVGAVQSDAYLVFTYWGYPGYGWGYPGWGYPGYPSYGAVKYKQGSIVWTMIDVRDVTPGGDAAEEVSALWVAGLNGALSGSGTNPARDIPQGIAQCFTQSPYILVSSAGN